MFKFCLLMVILQKIICTPIGDNAFSRSLFDILPKRKFAFENENFGRNYHILKRSKESYAKWEQYYKDNYDANINFQEITNSQVINIDNNYSIHDTIFQQFETNIITIDNTNNYVIIFNCLFDSNKVYQKLLISLDIHTTIFKRTLISYNSCCFSPICKITCNSENFSYFNDSSVTGNFVLLGKQLILNLQHCQYCNNFTDSFTSQGCMDCFNSKRISIHSCIFRNVSSLFSNFLELNCRFDINMCLFYSNQCSDECSIFYTYSDFSIHNSILTNNKGNYLIYFKYPDQDINFSITSCYIYNPDITNLSNKNISIDDQITAPDINLSIINYPKKYSLWKGKSFDIEVVINSFGLNDYINITTILDDDVHECQNIQIKRIEEPSSFIISINIPLRSKYGTHKIDLNFEGSIGRTFHDSIKFEIIKRQCPVCHNIYNVKLRHRR